MSYRLAFLIGSPRSGTTWLQTMLGAHSGVATTVELGLFSRYISPLLDNWESDVQRLEDRRNRYGLPALLSEERFEDLLRSLVREVYNSVHGKNPDAVLVLDKYPGYSLCVEQIVRLIPDASFIHLIRDGRDAAVSMLAANRSMGFGAATMARAAEDWRRCVCGARRASGVSRRYREVRYEELLSEPCEKLTELFEFLGLSVDGSEVERVVEENAFEQLKRSARGPDRDIPLDRRHLVTGRAGGWADAMSLPDRYLFDRIAGDLLVELGYCEPGWWRNNPAQAAAAPLMAFLPPLASFPGRLKQSTVAFGGEELRTFLIGRHRRRGGDG